MVGMVRCPRFSANLAITVGNQLFGKDRPHLHSLDFVENGRHQTRPSQANRNCLCLPIGRARAFYFARNCRQRDFARLSRGRSLPFSQSRRPSAFRSASPRFALRHGGRYARPVPAGNQSAHDDVFFQASQSSLLPMIGRFGQHAGGFLERCRRMNDRTRSTATPW